MPRPRVPVSPRHIAAPLVRSSVIALQLAAASTAAIAQSGTTESGRAAGDLPDVVVSGSRLPSTPSGLAQNVTVIDRKEILETNPARIEDLLGRLNGVYVDSVGAAGGFSSIYIRGAEQSHVLIMLDGVKLNDPTTTRGSAFDLSSIDVSQIERVEVLRGPASAIHGGEALAGVINIVTKRSVRQGVHGSGYAGVGEQGYARAGGDVAFGTDTFRGQLRMSRSLDSAPGDTGSLRLSNFSGSLRFVPSATLEGELFAHRTERKGSAFPDDSGGPRLAVNRQQSWKDSTDTIYGARFSAGDSRSALLQASVSVYERDEHADNAAIAAGVRFPVPAFVSDTNFRRTVTNATVTRDWSPGTSLVVGAEYQTEDGSLTSVGKFFGPGPSVTLPFQMKRDTGSVFAEGRFQVAKPVSLQVGVRHDNVQGLDGETTPHLGVVWSLPNNATTFKASYSEGFKPPSFFALGFPIGANPNLKPERSKNTELMLAHRLDPKGSLAQISVYHIDYKDLVDFDGQTFTNVNRGTIVVEGVEPAIDYRFNDRLRARMGFTLLNIDERDGLPPLRNRPTKKATAGVTYAIDSRSSVFGVVNYGGNFLDRSNPTGDINLSGATTVDLGYSIQFGVWRARLALDNLFDKQYEQFVGFPARGRRLRAELRGEF